MMMSRFYDSSSITTPTLVKFDGFTRDNGGPERVLYL